jgi:hypothetical protein
MEKTRSTLKREATIARKIAQIPTVDRALVGSRRFETSLEGCDRVCNLQQRRSATAVGTKPIGGDNPIGGRGSQHCPTRGCHVPCAIPAPTVLRCAVLCCTALHCTDLEVTE